MEKFLKIFTEIPLSEINELVKKQGAELNEVKKRLAFAATEIAHGTEAARAAEEAAAALFGGGANSANVPSIDLEMSESMPILDFLTTIKLFDSK